MAISLELTKRPSEMNENELAEVVVEIGFQIHRKWGPGLLESVYEELMAHHLRANGFFVEQQKDIPFEEDGVKLTIGFRADIIVEHKLHGRTKIYRAPCPCSLQNTVDLFAPHQFEVGLADEFRGSTS